MGGAPSEGLYVYAFDAQARRAERVQIVTDVISPSFVAIHAPTRMLYAAERRLAPDDGAVGALSAWTIDATGQIERAWKLAAGGPSTAHVCVSSDGFRLAIANPLGPSVGVCVLGADRAPKGPVHTVLHAGRGARERQGAPWPHSANFDASGNRILACDLGLDRVYLYDIDGNTGALAPAPQPFAQVSSGAGARHLAWSADGRSVYVANELDSTISVFSYDPAASSLICKQTISSLPTDDLPPNNQPAEIVASPCGRRLYVTNRGHDSIAWFEIAPDTQKLRPRGATSSLGDTPRHFALSPDGAFGFCANQLSGEIIGYAVDPADGRLEPFGRVCDAPSAACVAILDT
jgi:6-phosphogluconolactonase